LTRVQPDAKDGIKAKPGEAGSRKARSAWSFMARVGVIGAGIQGVCAALELARRGHDVDIFDKEADILQRASLWNEGKIHLGFMYAKDSTLRTARMMMQGSLQFAQLLQRWTAFPASELRVSLPFKYVVPVESLLGPAAIESHFAQVERLVKESVDTNGHVYLGQKFPKELFRRLDRADLQSEFCLSETAAAYQTAEVSVDTAQVRTALKRAINASARIRVFAQKKVSAVALADSGKFSIRIQEESQRTSDYDYVVNACWEDRLRIDASIAGLEGRPWLHRYKLAVHVSGYEGPAIGSKTFLVGAFGDVVEFRGGRLYLSWYPCCRIGTWNDLSPPEIRPDLNNTESSELLSSILRGLGHYVPSLRNLDLSQCHVTVAGGYIFSWGSTDVTDPVSELHNRFDIGIRRTGNYFSIDTGKYCMAPLFADHLGEMIECP
jgi:hypothetical protein